MHCDERGYADLNDMGNRYIGTTAVYCEVPDAMMRNAVESHLKFGEVDYKEAIRRDDKKNSCVPTGSGVSDEVRTRIRRNSRKNRSTKGLGTASRRWRL